MDQPNEIQLFGWLRARGYSEEEASKLIEDFTKSGAVGDGTVDPLNIRQVNPAYDLDE